MQLGLCCHSGGMLQRAWLLATVAETSKGDFDKIPKPYDWFRARGSTGRPRELDKSCRGLNN